MPSYDPGSCQFMWLFSRAFSSSLGPDPPADFFQRLLSWRLEDQVRCLPRGLVLPCGAGSARSSVAQVPALAREASVGGVCKPEGLRGSTQPHPLPPPRFGTRLSHQGPDLWLAEGPWPTSPASLEPSAVTVRSSGCRRCGRLVLQGPSLPMSPAETLRLAGCLPAQPHHQGYWKAARLQRSLRLVKENCLGVSVLHLGGVLRTLGRPWGQASRGCWTHRHRQGSPVSPGREG